jgi:hypothetical protein
LPLLHAHVQDSQVSECYCRCLVTLAVVEGSYHLSRSGGGAVLSAYVSVGTTSLECSVLECGQVYSTLCCLLVGTSHSDCTTMMCNLNVEYGVVVTGVCRPLLQ